MCGGGWGVGAIAQLVVSTCKLTSPLSKALVLHVWLCILCLVQRHIIYDGVHSPWDLEKCQHSVHQAM